MKSFLLIISLFICGITNAATYYISPTGNDATGNGSLANPWRTLYKATSTVTASGNIIHVLAGIYTETQTSDLRVGVSIEGDAAATTIIRGAITSNYTALLELQSPDATNGNQSISKITFDGQYVSASNHRTWLAIWVTGRSNVSIHDCVIKDFLWRGVIFNGVNANNPGTDVGYQHATGNTFYNNSMTNCADYGISGGGSGALNLGFQDGMLIYNNLIQQNERPEGLNGWPIKYWNQGRLKGCKIYNNTLVKKPYGGTYPGESGWDFAIEFFNVQGLEIYGNDIQNGAIDLNYNYKTTYAYSVWIHDNTISNTTFNPRVEGGIIFEFRTEHAIVENNIFNNKSYGITFNTRGPGNYGGDNLPNPGGPPAGGYSYLLNNTIRNNLFTNMYTGTGIGNSFGVGVISEGTDDPQINGFNVYNNTMVGRATNPSYIGIDLTSMPNGNGQNINIRNNIVTGFGSYWLRGSNPTNINGMMVTHNDVYGNGTNTPSWPGGNPANYTFNNHLSVNALFVSPTNFTLQPASPCIDAGVNVGMPYNGAAPDMGYMEFGGAVNLPPVANAGPDQTITLPTNYVTLSGSGTDADGTITAYQWTKVAGPAAGTIATPNTAVSSVTGMVQGTYRFELRVTDNGGAVGRDTIQVTVNNASNIPPVANAGTDQTITLPTNSVSLSGSGTDADGTITAYLWTKVAGPAAGTITTPTTAATSVTGLVQGVYRFELRVTDNGGAFGRDTVQITVNAAANIPPVANAGADQTITLPTNSVSLSGTGTDADGTITAYQWTKVAGPAAGTITSPNTAATSVTGLVQGVYRFALRVTDNNGAFGRDTVQITVNPAASNIPPVANAGPDQTIVLPANSVILSGSGTDADGIITAYQWTKIAGPANGTITNPNTAATSVTGLVQGVYRFELRVTDNGGAFGRDTVQITVNPGATNTPPSANAGPDQTIILPTNSVILSGSGIDPDGTITAYQWTKIAGPANGTIVNPNTAATSVTGLVQGVYRFELRVTDNSGAFGRDTVQITVNPAASNIPPVANAGADQTIVLPTSSVILSGSGTDADGTITAYQWTKIAGPANGTITNPNTAATSVTGLVQGVYRFELRVTDNNGAFGRDTVQVTVNAAVNIPPVANAGPDQTITLPVNNTTLSGSGTDPDGAIVSYAWRQISGPSNNVLFSLTSQVTFVNNMIEGVYEFELTVTDNLGAKGLDTVKVNVANIPANVPEYNGIKVYPNPVVDITTLEINKTSENQKVLLLITDAQGRKILANELSSTQNSLVEKINMTNMPKGIYLITVIFKNNERKTLKVIKSK